MKSKALFILLMGLPAVIARAAEPMPMTSPPCYVVIAVDVSGSMERTDSPSQDARGRSSSLRADAQVVSMQLLPYLYSDLHIGVCHFSDRVRYVLPSEDTAPLLAWGGSYLNEAACRNMVRSPDFTGSFHTDIDRPLAWAMARIQAARRQHGDGPGKIILLSRGDSRDAAARDLETGGSLSRIATRLVRENVRLYPVVINTASHRSGSPATEPSSTEQAAEAMMTKLASLTDGTTYRITPTRGMPDILMDIFGLGRPLSGESAIGRYDWATVIVGPLPASVSITPGGETTQGAPRTWPLDGQLEAEAGIRRSSVTSNQWHTTILRRPDRDGDIERSWEGRWTLSPLTGTRMYRIPSFLLHIEPQPGSPWWAHQQVRLAAHVLDRHKGARSARQIDPTAALSVRLTAWPQGQGEPWQIDDGRWTIPSRLYESGLFTVPAFGLYTFQAELIHPMADTSASIVDAASEVLVHPPCIDLSVVENSGAVLGSLSEPSEPLSIDVHGGQPVSFRLSPKGTSDAKPVSGTLHIEPLTPADWDFKEETEANLATELVQLPEGEERIFAWAEVEVETSAGLLPFRLPRCELVYQPAPLRVEASFADPRTALWAGELHRQSVMISAFPVFERDREQVTAMFPETLGGTHIRTVDLSSETAQVMTPRVRLVDLPKPTGPKGRTLKATYALESEIPLPPADRGQISIEDSIASLEGGVKTYGVVDPMDDGLFEWAVYQAPDDGQTPGLAETVYCGEPVQFTARWQTDVEISAVRFEIVHLELDEPIVVNLPMASGSRQASIETIPPGLLSGRTYPVHVYVTMKPLAEATPVEIKLQGGQFNARDRRLLLEELAVGDEAGRDIVSYPWEPVQIPLRVVFAGYIAGNSQHSELIDRVKKSCRVTLTSPSGDVEDLTDSIEWTTLVPSDMREGRATRCELKGHVSYLPQNTGRATVEMTAEFVREQAAPSTQRAHGHLAIREPRLALSVERVTSSQEDSLFDSQMWAAESEGLSPVTTELSTRLRITVWPIRWTAAPPNMTVRLLRRPSSSAPWTTAFSAEDALPINSPLAHEVQAGSNGQYAVEMVGRNPQSGQVVARLTTPIVLSVQPHEVVPVLAPATWITPHVRQWPFEYRVAIQNESGDAPQISAIAFQFLLPDRQPVWLDGSVHAGRPGGPMSLPLSLKSPEFLPPLQTPQDGNIQFRLSSRGQELVRWEHPNVRVLPPVLERLAFSARPSGSEIESTERRIELDGSTELWARPVFRAAPEIVGQWTRTATTVYLWPYSGNETHLSARVLQELKARDRTETRSDATRVYSVEDGRADGAVRVLPALARQRFWGWPKPATTQRYAIAASAAFQVPDAPDGSQIAEWVDFTIVNVVTAQVIPWCWWTLGVVGFVLLAVFILKILAPRPSGLDLDLRLEENVARVEPTSLHSPVAIELSGTSLWLDINLHIAHAMSRSKTTRPKPLVVASAAAGVILRRAIYPRRWAWALITPKIGAGAEHVQKGLLCVWTGPFARQGRAWSSQSGAIALPGKGQASSIALDLGYDMAGTTRSIRVNVRLRNGAPQRERQPADAGRSI